MSIKTYIIKSPLLKVLNQLEPIRDLAKWLKILVDEWNLWDDVLDILIEAVQWAVSTVKSDLDKEKLQRWLEALQKMKEMEDKSRIEDEKDLEDLDNMLENI